MNKEKKLFTPGPLSTSKLTKSSMMYDYGSRDPLFLNINKQTIQGITNVIKNSKNLITIPIQGSGTFAVEAMISSFIPKEHKVLVAINGAYGERIAKICKYKKISLKIITFKETEAISSLRINKELAKGNYSHLIVVHCETTTGILNPLEEISNVCKRNKVKLLVDAMSSFGGIIIDYKKVKFEALAASANKCLEGIPGISFCITHKSVPKNLKGNSNSLSLDLYDQWYTMKLTGQWRFTPPTHVLLALKSALNQLKIEGGVKSRNKRYMQNCNFIRQEMQKIGFNCILKDSFQAPIIVTFETPRSITSRFSEFYNRLSNEGYIIYPGKITKMNTFRIGCIGNINLRDFKKLITAIKKVIKTMNLSIVY